MTIGLHFENFVLIGEGSHQNSKQNCDFVEKLHFVFKSKLIIFHNEMNIMMITQGHGSAADFGKTRLPQ